MQPAAARKLGAQLVEAGILTDFEVSAHGASGLRVNHATSAIHGHWAEKPGRPSRRCSIVCPDVARELLAARAWTVDAIRGCSHTVTTSVPYWTDKIPWPNRINPDYRKAPIWKPSRASKRATESTRRKAEAMSPTTESTEKCCQHGEGLHRPRSRGMQPYCSACRGGKATHEYRAGTPATKSVTPAATSAKPKPKNAPTPVAKVAPKPAAKRPATRAKGDECSERGCHETSRRRGMCRHHYRAWLKTDRELVA